MDLVIAFLCTVIAIITLPIIGIYSIYKYIRKNKYKIANKPQPPVWMMQLPESVRNVRLKEFNKETQKFLTKKWFLEYWQGQRSPFIAWFTWFYMPFVLLFVLVVLTRVDILIAIIVKATIFLVSSIILWRCAINSRTRFHQYFARLVAIFGFINICLSLGIT